MPGISTASRRHSTKDRAFVSGMESSRDVEFVLEPQAEGGDHAYAPELPGLHTEGDSLEEATANAVEALGL